MLKLLLFISFTIFTAQSLATDLYQLAVESANRPAEDKIADTRRQPEKVLRFFDIQPGQNVLDLFSGAGYYTELTSKIVGESGHIDAHNNNAYIRYIGEDKLLKRYRANRLANVSQLHQEANDLSLCTSCYDRVLMVLTFHDLFYVDKAQGWPKIDAPILMTKIKRALKPAGMVGIVDHIAPIGSGEQAGQTLHRIDSQLIKLHMQKWGFTLKEEAGFLKNPDDDGKHPMWDPSVKGKTSRAIMTFIKN